MMPTAIRIAFPITIGLLVGAASGASTPVPRAARTTFRTLVAAQDAAHRGGDDASDVASFGQLLVLNKSNSTASFLDPTTGAVLGTTGTGVGPHEAATHGGFAYVADYGEGQDGRTITVIDVAERRAMRAIDLGRHRRPHGIVAHPYDGHLFVTCEANQALIEVSPSTGEIIETWETDREVSHMVVLDAERDLAYVTSIGSGSCSRIDLDSGEVRHLETGAGAEGLDLSPDGGRLWVTNRAADTISVVDTGTFETIADIPTGRFPIRARFTPDGTRVLVSCAVSGEVIAYDATTRDEIRRIETGGEPIGILIEPSGRWAFVAKTRQDEVVVLDLDRYDVARVLETGRTPDGMAWIE